jgi:putative FmdB family regulatory protein
MPTYDYECLSCGHTFELFQSMSEEPAKECPKCGKEVRRLISPGLGIIFKGSGFYVTDNRKGSNGSSKSTAKGEKAAESTASNDSSSGENSGGGESKAGSTTPKDSAPKEKAASESSGGKKS